MDVRQDSPGPTYVRPSRRVVDTRSTYRDGYFIGASHAKSLWGSTRP